MKVYRGGNEGGHAASPHLVTIEDGGELHMLAHRVRHSPTGLSWGYAGSGPADLARSLLWDVLGYEPSPSLYQEFKFDVVAKWPQSGSWTMSQREIAMWVERWQSRHPGRPTGVESWDDDPVDDEVG